MNLSLSSLTGKAAKDDCERGFAGAGRLLPIVAIWHDRLAYLILLERTRWFNWLPCGLGLGIALYFTLAAEPGLVQLLIVALGATACAVSILHPNWQRRLLWSRLLILASLLTALGFTFAALRTQIVEAPVLPRAGVYNVAGTVALVEPRTRGARLTLVELEIERLALDATPKKVRFTVRNSAEDIKAGDRISARAMLQPPSGPMVPGGFDFARQAFFQELAGVGFAFGYADIVGRGELGGIGLVFADWRQTIAMRAQNAFDGAAGAVSAALLTGLRGNIPQTVWTSMQGSGLAHLLAISGLHIGLIAGTIYLFSRYTLASITPLALRLPVKRCAAAIAIVGAAFYLGLAGAPIPTQRAFLMTGIALLAVMIDRNPISMRLVAFAATVILVLRPDSMLGASFQMSFAAVVALVAFYESVGRFRLQHIEDAPPPFWHTIALYLLGIAATSAIATLATAPLAAYHFGKLPTYGILANLIAVPLTAFWVMPLGLAGVLLIPFGLDQPFLHLMGIGVDAILTIAAWTSALPGAVIYIHLLPKAVLILSAIGGLWLCLWRERWRLLGVLPVAAALIIAFHSKPFDLLIAPDLGLFAFRQERVGDPTAVWVQRYERDGFRERAFIAAMGAGAAAQIPKSDEAGIADINCDQLGCVVQRGRMSVSLLRSAAGIVEDCARSDVLFALNGPRACPTGAKMHNFFDLRESGGYGVHLETPDIEIIAVHRGNEKRPWTPKYARTLD